MKDIYTIDEMAAFICGMGCAAIDPRRAQQCLSGSSEEFKVAIEIFLYGETNKLGLLGEMKQRFAEIREGFDLVKKRHNESA